ncbi:GINS complex subunit 4 [Tieghemostelium lacteum]|uniref:DNA replication complex GINS protein SLD5 n=1 Tax=Tieghemostelium lacteum TaxID=361077 RepID=A0A152A3S8_TIELA|nr:GINS complex subunit 4 [Tieghemostelium lacteum]|eukprot:KYR00701.1 GINS complex subunit 4 [Tieghemostelium lacteum]
MDNLNSDNQNYLNRLKQCWINEKFSPDLLNFEGELVAFIMEQIEEKEKNISEDIKNSSHQFTANLYEMEIERLKYIIKCYLKIRLKKIEKFYAHILQDDDEILKLSPNELKYCKSFSNLLENHFKKTFLDALPDVYKENEKENATKPQLDSYIFCKPKENIGDYQIDDEETVEFKINTIYFLRYKPIKFFVESGKIDLI